MMLSGLQVIIQVIMAAIHDIQVSVIIMQIWFVCRLMADLLGLTLLAAIHVYWQYARWPLTQVPLYLLFHMHECVLIVEYVYDNIEKY